jgi:Holliday junction resolvase
MAAVNGRQMKVKGATFERAVVDYLKSAGFPFAERHYGAGRPDDVGDVDGIVGWTVECKAHKALALAVWTDEAERERVNGRQPYAAVVAKRRNRPTADAYVVIPLSTFAALLAEDVTP